MWVELLIACLVAVAHFGKLHKTLFHYKYCGKCCGKYQNRFYLFPMISITQATTCSLLLPMSLAIHWVCPIQMILEH